MSKSETELELQVSVAKMQKDIEYIKEIVEKQQDEIKVFREFLSRWKGGALVLLGLGGVCSWVIDHLIAK